ncbi:unnamed protein product [Prunus armeniaca]|uniref:Uncharacterized protein n=1 Tax=Prunus armeniaca TaxID=36596 RepID=A0A6J5TIQ1_PRUAR|nr:unnamed protein product [Prunus armeniaca]
MEGYGSNSRYDPLNDINKKNDATDVGISSSRSSHDVDWSDAGRGGQGKVPKGGGHNIRRNTIIGKGFTTLEMALKMTATGTTILVKMKLGHAIEPQTLGCPTFTTRMVKAAVKERNPKVSWVTTFVSTKLVQILQRTWDCTTLATSNRTARLLVLKIIIVWGKIFSKVRIKQLKHAILNGRVSGPYIQKRAGASSKCVY